MVDACGWSWCVSRVYGAHPVLLPRFEVIAIWQRSSGSTGCSDIRQRQYEEGQSFREGHSACQTNSPVLANLGYVGSFEYVDDISQKCNARFQSMCEMVATRMSLRCALVVF